MRHIFVLLIALFYSTCSIAQKPTWAWAKYGNNSKGALNSRVCLDDNGNIYTVGVYSGNIGFNDSSYMAQGVQGLYLVKYDQKGNFLWSRGINGTGTIVANALTTELNGDVYVGGYFTDTIFLGDSVFSSIGSKDIFLIKFNSKGQFSWAKSYGSKKDDVIGGMAIDSRHNLILNGNFCDSTIHLGTFVLKSDNNVIEMFILKHDSTGKLIWAKQAKSKVGDVGSGVVVDKSDNIYIAGNFYGNIYFDSLKVSPISSGFLSGDVFLARYDSSGIAKWAKTVGGFRTLGGSGRGSLFSCLITIDTFGNPIIGSQYFDCCVKFDNGTIIPDPANTSVVGMWFAKFSTVGGFVWAENIPGTSDDYTYAMTCDKAGDIYLAGEYYFNRVFDGDTAYYPIGSQVGMMFLAKYLNNGNFSWLQTTGSSACGAVPFDIAVKEPDEVAAVGQFYGGSSINFGSTVCINSGTIGNGFIAKTAKSNVGIEQYVLGLWNIWPNPASHILRLQIQRPGQFDRYAISNTIGATVSHGSLSAQSEQSLTIPDVADGMFYLTLIGRSLTVTKKISIQH